MAIITVDTIAHSIASPSSRVSASRERRNSVPISTITAQRPGGRISRKSSIRKTAAISSTGT